MPFLMSFLLLVVLSSLAVKMFYLLIRQGDLICGGKKENGRCWREAMKLTGVTVLCGIVIFFLPEFAPRLAFFVQRLPFLRSVWQVLHPRF
ncbi:MAG TPA: hypothetical protein VKR06_21265 [Ktedonosporobacter sp.]|nr:hypothetical protein [Ktedonosporobacter sp.]